MSVYDGYGRVSRTAGRAGERFGSPAEQEQVVRAKADELGAAFGLWVYEQDVSGTKAATKRKVEQLVKRVETGLSSGIIVSDFSRLTREDDWAAVMLVGRVALAGGRVVGVQDSFDSSSEFGIAQAALLARQARSKIEVAQARSLNARKAAVERGVFVGRNTFGYIRNVDGRFEPDPVTGPLVRLAFERRLRGESVTSIQRWLFGLGHKMSRSSLVDLLRNEVYLGVSRSGEFRNDSAHEPLVSVDLYNLVQERRGERPVRTGALENAGICKRLARCGSCGASMVVTWTRGAAGPDGTRRKIPAYVCSSRRHECQAAAYIQVTDLDRYITEIVETLLRFESPVATILAADKRLTEATHRLRQKEQDLADLRALDYSAAGISLESHLAMIKNAEAHHDLARAEWANARAAADALGLDGSETVPWSELGVERQRRFLRGVLNRIVVAPARGKRGVPVHERVSVIDQRGVLLNKTERPVTLDITYSDGSNERLRADAESATKLMDEHRRTGGWELRDDGRAMVSEAWVSVVQADHPDAVVR